MQQPDKKLKASIKEKEETKTGLLKIEIVYYNKIFELNNLYMYNILYIKCKNPFYVIYSKHNI